MRRARRGSGRSRMEQQVHVCPSALDARAKIERAIGASTHLSIHLSTTLSTCHHDHVGTKKWVCLSSAQTVGLQGAHHLLDVVTLCKQCDFVSAACRASCQAGVNIATLLTTASLSEAAAAAPAPACAHLASSGSLSTEHVQASQRRRRRKPTRAAARRIVADEQQSRRHPPLPFGIVRYPPFCLRRNIYRNLGRTVQKVHRVRSQDTLRREH